MSTSNTYHRAPDSIAAAPPGCPMHTAWSPLDADYLDDPYPDRRRTARRAPGVLRGAARVRRGDADGGHRARLHASRRVRLDQRAGSDLPTRRRGRRSARGTRLRPGRGDVEPARTRPRPHPRLHTAAGSPTGASSHSSPTCATGLRNCSTTCSTTAVLPSTWRRWRSRCRPRSSSGSSVSPRRTTP